MNERNDELSKMRTQLRRWNEGDLEQALSRFQRRRETEARLEDDLAAMRGAFRRWSPERVEQELQAFRQQGRAASQKRRRWVLGGATVAAVVAVAAMLLLLLDRPPTSAAGVVQSAAAVAAKGAQGPRQNAEASSAGGVRHLALEDGSEVMLPNRTSQVRVTEHAKHQVVVVVDAGRADFRVKHDPERRFVVQVGRVRIEDLGTTFSVERTALDVSLRVTEGKVRVLWGGRAAELVAGQHGTYPLGESAPEAADSGKEASPPPPDAKPVEAAATWRAAARDGRYKEAFQQLERESFSSVRDEPSDLLLAADVARLSGHTARAVEPLRSLLKHHRGDPRSPAAAFTLGSVLLRDLNRPGEAAQAFEDAQRLAPAGNLAEDAAARAAEAWLKAGDRARAQAALERYRARYGNGRHLAFLTRLIQSR